MRSLHLLLMSAGIIAAASLSTSKSASARQLSFKECKSLNRAALKGGRVGRGQQGKVNAVVRDCSRLYGKHLSTVRELRARQGSPSADLLGDVLDIIGTSGLGHGKSKKKHH